MYVSVGNLELKVEMFVVSGIKRHLVVYRLYRGANPTQLYRDYKKQHMDPY